MSPESETVRVPLTPAPIAKIVVLEEFKNQNKITRKQKPLKKYEEDKRRDRR